MNLNITDEWITKAAKMEEGCSVSAGSPRAFYRQVECYHARESAAKHGDTFVVFEQGGEFRHMTLKDWRRCKTAGVLEREGYRHAAQVSPSGRVRITRQERVS